MKHAVITGGGSGIGQALAWELAAKNMTVTIIGRQLDHLKKTQEKYPDNIRIIAADLSQPEAWQHIIEKFHDQKIHYLIHNAATEAPTKSLTEISLEEWRYAMTVNVEAILFLTQGLINNLTGGRILLLSSGLAHYPLPGVTTYCVSKAAVQMLYLSFNAELADKNILTGIVRPGIIDTPMQERLRSIDPKTFPQATMFKDFKEQRKLATPAEVGNFISTLLLETDDKTFTETAWNFSNV